MSVTDTLRERRGNRGHGLFANPIGDLIRIQQARKWGLPVIKGPELRTKEPKRYL